MSEDSPAPAPRRPTPASQAEGSPPPTPGHAGPLQLPLHPGVVRDVAVSVILLWGSVLATMAVVTEQQTAGKSTPLHPPAPPVSPSPDQAAPAHPSPVPAPQHSAPPDGAGAQAPSPPPGKQAPVPDETTAGGRDGDTWLFDTGAPRLTGHRCDATIQLAPPGGHRG